MAADATSGATGTCGVWGRVVDVVVVRGGRWTRQLLAFRRGYLIDGLRSTLAAVFILSDGFFLLGCVVVSVYELEGTRKTYLLGW